ncbi:hypothetical protein C8R43DRAFT_659836 [Mycena crocata]|nr:hypothetical protein C8R43DRAFT_659836 [Mycena crocata]
MAPRTSVPHPARDRPCHVVGANRPRGQELLPLPRPHTSLGYFSLVGGACRHRLLSLRALIYILTLNFSFTSIHPRLLALHSRPAFRSAATSSFHCDLPRQPRLADVDHNRVLVYVARYDFQDASVPFVPSVPLLAISSRDASARQHRCDTNQLPPRATTLSLVSVIC